MELIDIQRKLKQRYGKTDEASGPLFLLSVLMEECGELASALRHHQDGAKEEVTDVVFCALSIANLLDADVEHLLDEKYLRRSFEDVTQTWTDINF